jgi:hypothetical protein
VSFHRQPSASFKALAREALAELDADEPDLSPAELMGGTTAWGDSDSWVRQAEAARDPANAPTMRPHVVAPCQKLQSHSALRLHCTCGRGLDFLALASLATGVLVVSSPRLLPPKQRRGGTQDLASVDDKDPNRPWTFAAWEHMMSRRSAMHRSSWQAPPIHPVLGPNAGVMGDTAKRQTFNCEGCGATHTFLNITLLRLTLKAIAEGKTEVRLDGSTNGG